MPERAYKNLAFLDLALPRLPRRPLRSENSARTEKSIPSNQDRAVGLRSEEDLEESVASKRAPDFRSKAKVASPMGMQHPLESRDPPVLSNSEAVLFAFPSFVSLLCHFKPFSVCIVHCLSLIIVGRLRRRLA